MLKIQHEEQHSNVGGLLKEAVFGFNDGVVSTFAVIAGLTGGLIEQKTVLLAALATLVAGAFSMGLGTYLGSKSERDLYENEVKRELWEMKNLSDRERQEIRDIYMARGFEGKLLEDVVAKITSNPKVWLDTMMTEELGFAQKPPKPGLNGITMSAAFMIGSLIPTFSYFFPASDVKNAIVFGLPPVFAISLFASIVGLIIIGMLKTRFTGKKKIVSAMETLAIGVLAAGGTYLTGMFLA